MAEENSFPGVVLKRQFVKNLQFLYDEGYNTAETGSVNPQLNVRIGVDAKPVGSGRSEVNINVSVVANTEQGGQMFTLTCSYSGLFELKNVPPEDTEPLLLVYCPSILFPFLRRIVCDVTMDAGLPGLMLDIVDFSRLYQETKLKQAK